MLPSLWSVECASDMTSYAINPRWRTTELQKLHGLTIGKDDHGYQGLQYEIVLGGGMAFDTKEDWRLYLAQVAAAQGMLATGDSIRQIIAVFPTPAGPPPTGSPRTWRAWPSLRTWVLQPDEFGHLLGDVFE